MSDRRALTSPANGRRSRGPRTPDGKAVSRYNGLRHGILSVELVIEGLGESEGELALLRRQLWEELGPVGVVEELLVERILVAYWRLRRVLIAEGGLLSQQAERAADRILRLRRLAGRRPPTPLHGGGSEAVGLSDDELAAFAASQLLGAADAERLRRYETMLERQLYRAVDQLRDLQERRIALLVRVSHDGASKGVSDGLADE